MAKISHEDPEEAATCAYIALETVRRAIVILDLFLTGRCDRRNVGEAAKIATLLEKGGSARFRLSNPSRTMLHCEWPDLDSEEMGFVRLADSALAPADLRAHRRWRVIDTDAAQPDLSLPFAVEDWQ